MCGVINVYTAVYSIFTQVSKAFQSTVALQVVFFKHLGDVATVLLDVVCLRFVFFCFFMSSQMDEGEIRSLCGALAVVRLFLQTIISLDYYS